MGLTELVFILDKSGSMGGLEDDTIGGYNALLAKQREVEGLCLVTTVLFDHGYEVLHERLELSHVQPLTRREYQVGGSTALLDAMGRTIQKMAARQGEDDARKVMCVIITDGQENSSREFSARRVRALVEERRENHGWEFIFLGANMDAIETAARYGIEADRAQSFHADPQGIALNFAVMSETVAAYRRTGKVEDEWKTSIAADYEQRRGR
jgi:hypothetical protein